MNPNELSEGVQSAPLFASFLGALIGLSYAAPMTKGKALAALFSGWVVAVYATPLLCTAFEYYFKLPVAKQVESSLSFFLGLVALRLTPVLLFHVEQLKNKTL